MAFETVTGYCWPQSVEGGRHGRRCTCRPPAAGRCRSRSPASGPSARSCSPTTPSRPTTTPTPTDAAPPRVRLAGGARARRRADVAVGLLRGRPRRSTSTASRAAATPSSSCARRVGAPTRADPAGAGHQHLARLQRLRRPQPLHRRHAGVAAAADVARATCTSRRAPAAGSPPPHPPDPQMAAHVGYLAAQPPLAVGRVGRLARLGAAVPAVGRGRRATTSTSSPTPTSRTTPTSCSAAARYRCSCRSATTSTGRARCATPSRASSAGGGNAAFFSGNTSFWQVRLEDPTPEGPAATMVGYKGFFKQRPGVRHRPRQAELTSIWSDHLIGRPENHMTGVSFARGGYHRIGKRVTNGAGGYTIHRPDHWLFDGTGLGYGDVLGAGGHDRRLRVRRLRLHLPRRPALPHRRRRHARRLRDPRHRAGRPLHPHDTATRPPAPERAVRGRVHRRRGCSRQPRRRRTWSASPTATPCSAPTRRPAAASWSRRAAPTGPTAWPAATPGRADHPQHPRPPRHLTQDERLVAAQEREVPVGLEHAPLDVAQVADALRARRLEEVGEIEPLVAQRLLHHLAVAARPRRGRPRAPDRRAASGREIAAEATVSRAMGVTASMAPVTDMSSRVRPCWMRSPMTTSTTRSKAVSWDSSRLPTAAQDDPEEGVDHDRAEDDAHQGATHVVYPRHDRFVLRSSPWCSPRSRPKTPGSMRASRTIVSESPGGGSKVQMTSPPSVVTSARLGFEAVVVEDGEVALVGADLDRRREAAGRARPRSRTGRRARLAPDRRSGWSPAGRPTSPAPCPCASRAAA